LSHFIFILVLLSLYFGVSRLFVGKMDWGLEVAKLLWSVLAALIFLLIFVFLLDVFVYVISGGWINPEDGRNIGDWPIVSGTIRAALYSPLSHVSGIVFGLGVMARVMLGNHTPILLGFLDAKEKTDA
jgi:hypothetical protein